MKIVVIRMGEKKLKEGGRLWSSLEEKGAKCARAYLNTEIEFSFGMNESTEGLWCHEMKKDRRVKQRSCSFKDEQSHLVGCYHWWNNSFLSSEEDVCAVSTRCMH